MVRLIEKFSKKVVGRCLMPTQWFATQMLRMEMTNDAVGDSLQNIQIASIH